MGLKQTNKQPYDSDLVKRWTAKRKSAVVMDIFKDKTTVAEVARRHDLTVTEVESWLDEAQRNMKTVSGPGCAISVSNTRLNSGKHGGCV